jgi:hypothetical protein
MEEQIEIWKDVVGYEGIYQISSFGRLKTISRAVKTWFGSRVMVEKIRKPGKWPNEWYTTYILSKNRVNKLFSAHRLVAISFIDNPNNYPEVNHLDGDKTNNRVSNLEWCTSSQNKSHSHRTGLQVSKRGIEHHFYGKTGASHPRYGRPSNPVKGKDHYQSKIVLDQQTGIFYDTIKDAAIVKNIKMPYLSKQLNGKRRNKSNMVLA